MELKFSKENHDEIVVSHLLQMNARASAVEMLLTDVYARISNMSIDEIQERQIQRVESHLALLQKRLITEFDV